jgi:hypothetical protein
MFESAHLNSVCTEIVVLADQRQYVVEINGKHLILMIWGCRMGVS